MSSRFITYVIIGVAFGFTQLWFVYWVVKLFKEKQRILKARKAGAPAAPAVQSAPPAGEPDNASNGEAGGSTAGPP
jgi:hypothetical protein